MWMYGNSDIFSGIERSEDALVNAGADQVDATGADSGSKLRQVSVNSSIDSD